MFQIQGLFLDGFNDERLAAIGSLAEYLGNHLGDKRDLQSLFAMQAHVYEIQASGTRALMKNAMAGRDFACKAGCDSCCRATDVDFTPSEAFYLAYHIRHSGLFPSGEMTIPARGETGDGCPLLDPQGMCSAYEGRPLSCRYIHSTELAACLARLRTRLGGAKLPPPFSNFRTSLSAAQFLLFRRLGLDARWMVLDKTIGKIVNSPILAEEWLAGGRLPDSLNADLPVGEFLQLIEGALDVLSAR